MRQDASLLQNIVKRACPKNSFSQFCRKILFFLFFFFKKIVTIKKYSPSNLWQKKVNKFIFVVRWALLHSKISLFWCTSCARNFFHFALWRATNLFVHTVAKLVNLALRSFLCLNMLIRKIMTSSRQIIRTFSKKLRYTQLKSVSGTQFLNIGSLVHFFFF